MKKIVVSLIVLIIIVFSCAYYIIPAQLIVSNVIKVPVNIDGAFRELSIKKNWEKWWPETNVENNSKKLSYNGYKFTVQNILYNALIIGIKKNNTTDSSFLQFLPVGKDSVQIAWTTNVSTGANPFSRISSYFHAISTKKNTGTILTLMAAYLKPSINLYGIDIRKEKVAIEFMITTSKKLSHYPTNEDVYAIINELQQYITSKNGKTESSPMLNIVAIDSLNYKAQVAIPVKNKIPENEKFKLKAMFKGGNILVANIKGGKNTIDESIKNFDRYMNDYQKTMMAMPFQLLLTDRIKQTDSTKWITQLYYPVN